MTILSDLTAQFKALFPDTENGEERFRWFVLTLQAILVPVTASRTSNLLRSIETLFGLVIPQWNYYTFMASPKLPWIMIWEFLWRAIPKPFTDGRLLLALDDSINPKTGKHIFACQNVFDHAAKTNQNRYPWSQTIVTVGLLKRIHERWCCLPLAFAFYFRRKTLEERLVLFRRKPVVFQNKFQQAVRLIDSLAQAFGSVPILVITDSWFGNNGLFKPLRRVLGTRVHLLSRLRVNSVLYALPKDAPGKLGRPRKYGERLGSVTEMAGARRTLATACTIFLYGRTREVMTYSELYRLKTLKCTVRVLWVYRKTQWIALVTTDLSLSVEQIIQYYGARWKIEAGFREIKQEIGSSQTQTRNPQAVYNHLQFCMVATTITWIYAEQLNTAPIRRYATAERTEYAFADVRRSLAKSIGRGSFGIDCQDLSKPKRNPLIATIMRLVA